MLNGTMSPRRLSADAETVHKAAQWGGAKTRRTIVSTAMELQRLLHKDGEIFADFHVWCHQLLRWDLCASPIDLEQREGRIQRFGGLSIRSALAEELKEQALQMAEAGGSPWIALAEHAERAFQIDGSGRSPWWSCPGEKTERIFVVLPQSRRTVRFNQLSRLRWLYRLALGRPHQQDFIETISQFAHDGRQKFALRLSAWRDETANT